MTFIHFIKVLHCSVDISSSTRSNGAEKQNEMTSLSGRDLLQARFLRDSLKFSTNTIHCRPESKMVKEWFKMLLHRLLQDTNFKRYFIRQIYQVVPDNTETVCCRLLERAVSKGGKSCSHISCLLLHLIEF